MPLSLVDLQKQSQNPLQKAFILDLLRAGELMGSVTLVDVDALQINDKRWQTLPSAGFRKFGGGYSESTGTTEDVMETLALLGGDAKIDKVATKVRPSVETPLATQMKMKARAVTFVYNNAFINGDQGVDPDSFEGVKKRVSNMPSRMTLDLSPGAGDSLKVKANAAAMNTFLDALHTAVKIVDGANRIYVNENTLIQYGSVMRNLGIVNELIELYDKKFDSFYGIPLIDVGLKSDKSTEIITNTEDPGDAGNDSTSIYVARMDDNDGLCGLKLAGMGIEAYDPLNGNEMEGGPQYLRRIDFATGLRNPSQYCICRIKGFKMAAA